jgi:predicted solute-binding protein
MSLELHFLLYKQGKTLQKLNKTDSVFYNKISSNVLLFLCRKYQLARTGAAFGKKASEVVTQFSPLLTLGGP